MVRGSPRLTNNRLSYLHERGIDRPHGVTIPFDWLKSPTTMGIDADILPLHRGLLFD